jgi:predicted  nucleic acid-binding Zn-ribbon protein
MNFNDKHNALAHKMRALLRTADELQLRHLEETADHEAQRAARQRAVVETHAAIREVRAEIHQLHQEHDKTRQASAMSILSRLHRQGVDVGEEGRALLGVDKGTCEGVSAPASLGVSHAV